MPQETTSHDAATVKGSPAHTTDYAVAKGKGWKPNEKVARSKRRALASVDILRPCAPQEIRGLPRTQFGPVFAAYLINNSTLRHGQPSNPHELRFVATDIFLQAAVGLQPGQSLSVATLWAKFIELVRELNPELAEELLVRPEHREAFLWHAAAMMAGVQNLITKNVRGFVVVKLKRNRKPPKGIMTLKGGKGGKRVLFYETHDGDTIPLPKKFRAVWPFLLFPGNRWRRQIVTEYCVANAVLNWPPRELDHLKLTLDMIFADEYRRRKIGSAGKFGKPALQKHSPGG